IDRMSVDKYDISILMLDKSGRLLNDVPKHVHIHHLQAYSIMKNILNDPFKQTLLHLLKKRKLTKSIVFTVIFILCKLFKTRSFLFRYLLRDVSEIKHKYDIAVAYAGPMDFISYFIAHKIKAKRKIQWIH